MIYSPAFDGLPDEARAAVFARMKDILSGRDRQAHTEILDDTLKGWR